MTEKGNKAYRDPTASGQASRPDSPAIEEQSPSSTIHTKFPVSLARLSFHSFVLSQRTKWHAAGILGGCYRPTSCFGEYASPLGLALVRINSHDI